jgi:Amt family ammonium transporter
MEVMIGLGAACLLIRLGFSLYRTGLLRAKNAAGTLLRTLTDFCVASLAFWAIGAAILFQTRSPYFSLDSHLIMFRSGGTAELFFMMTVVLVGTGIIGGAVAERARFFPVLGASVLLAGLVIPIGAQWAWTGWLHRLGFIDIGGGAWLHFSGGVCAAVAVLIIGPRTGKYHKDGSASIIPGHNVPLAGVGAIAMLVGWSPYLVGCLLLNGGRDQIGPAATSTLLCAAAAGLASTLFGRYRYGKPDVIITIMGFLGGLVAITAGAGRLGSATAVLLGIVAGLVVPMAAVWIDLVGRIDDPIGAIAIHGVGGLFGTIATGFLVHGTIAHRLHQTGIQVMGAIAIGLLSLLLAGALFGLLRATMSIRVSEADEYDGLDLAEHDVGAYPDFQQNTIKSYHLREA